MLARVSYKDVMQNGLVQVGPDSVYVPDIRKFQLVTKWLHEEHVLLLGSPPGSGKTSFAVHFADYLANQCFTAYYLDASRSNHQVNDCRSMDDVWQERFNLPFWQICEWASTSRRPVYVIIDEAQAWYPANTALKHVEYKLDMFWTGMKYLKGTHDWSNYFKRWSRGASESLAASMSAINVHILCLARYDEKNLGSLVFTNPMDPATKLYLPLGLNFLRLDREKTYELITKYIEIKESEGRKTLFSIDRDVCNLIFEQTNGHAGAIRALLDIDKTTREDIFDPSHTTYESLNGYHAFLSVNADTIQQLLPNDMALLVRHIVSYKQGNREFPDGASYATRLIKLGVFIKTTGETITGRTSLAFSSPLHFDLALYNVLHRKVDLQPSRDCFERAVKEMVLRMSPKLLQDTAPGGHDPYERRWQDECCKSFRSMSHKALETEVGREFNQRAYFDMYVNDDLQWGIELIRPGGDKQLGERVGHFRESDGRYRSIPLREYAVLNFTDKVPDEATLDMYNDVWHLVYNSTYTKVTVYRNFIPSDWDLIGYQGRTEY